MKIAIVKLSALGDIIHAMVVLQFIKQHNPKAQIDWVVEAGFKAILENNPDINQIHTINLKQVKAQKSLRLLIRELRQLRKLPKYDVVIDMQGLIKSALVARLIPSKRTFGFDKASLREPFAAYFYSHTCHKDYADNVIERNAFIVSSALDIEITHQDLLNKQAFLHSAYQSFEHLLSEAKSNVILVPGASFASKIYPVEQYAQLTQQLDVNFIITWGNEQEKVMASEIQRLSPEVKITNQLSLDTLKNLIAQADLVIGGDTGPTHMAWASDIASITLFGVTPAQRNTYATPINQTLASNNTVNAYKIDKHDLSIKEIQVDDIVKMTKELLKESV